jgi:UDPglucose--hexose-1-phosphate uridylyltransferase
MRTTEDDAHIHRPYPRCYAQEERAMPELRQNIATKEWVIIASERAKRPNAYIEPKPIALTEGRNAYEEGCPFCPGNEELDLEVERYPNNGAWRTRIVRNKYPALATEGVLTRSFDGVQRSITGIGYHEVIVEHPHHNTTLALMDAADISMVFETYQHRGWEICKDQRVEQIVYFKNHGERAGASLQHTHSQIVGLPIVPSDIRRRIEEARRFFDDTGYCVYCTMLAEELERGERLIAANDHFVAFNLYAASSPFHSWILPRQHRSSFRNAQTEELSALAEIVRDLLRRLYFGLNDPAYNLIVRSSPVKETESGYFHWYVTLVPRLSRSAGFELGSGVWINPSLPEACAEFLRMVEI